MKQRNGTERTERTERNHSFRTIIYTLNNSIHRKYS